MLYREEAHFAEVQLNVDRTRHSLGLAASLDTLSAKLAWINAISRLHDAESNEMQTREELAFYCGLDFKSVVIDSTLAVSLTRLPPPEQMIREAEQFDPQLRIFDVAAERLELTRAHTRNSLLPNVDLTASMRRSHSESTEEEHFFSNSVIGLIASYAFPVKSRKLALEKTNVSIKVNDLERKQYKKELLLKVRELNRSWEREFRSIEIARSARQIAEQTLDATREGHSVGTVDRLSLDKAENDYRIAVIDLLEKEIIMKQLEIVFDELTGATLTRLGVAIE
jgi:outer membrane protein TolC